MLKTISTSIDVDIDVDLEDFDDDDLIDELENRGFYVSKHKPPKPHIEVLDKETLQFLLDLVDKQTLVDEHTKTWYTRRVREKLLEILRDN